MAKSRQQTQLESDARRGVKVKGFKLPIVLIEQIEQLAASQNITQKDVIEAAIKLYAESLT